MSEDLSVDYLDGLPPAKREELARANDPGLTALRQYLASGQAVAFLGAGVSAPLYPLWAGLIGELVDAASGRLGQREAAACRALARESPEEVVEIIRRELGAASYREVLREVLRVRVDSESGRSWTTVQELICRCAFKAVATTNYDPGIVDARIRVRTAASATGFITWEDDLGLDRWRTGDVFGDAELPVLFAHGQHNRPDSVVLATTEYRRAYAGKLPQVLARLLDGHLVWIGFSFADQRISAILREVADRTGTRTDPGSAPRHIAVMAWDPDAEDNDLGVLARRAEIAYGAELVLYPAPRGDHSALGRLLAGLTDDRFSPVADLPAIAAPPPLPETGKAVGRIAERWVPAAERMEHFTGRSRELARLDRWAADPQVALVGITAWGGAGKTALVTHWVVEAAGAARRAGVQGVFGWSFYADPSAEHWAESLLKWAQQNLRIVTPAPWRQAEAVLRLLRVVPLLLVLDGLEVVQEGPAGDGFGRLLDGTLREVLAGACQQQHGGLILLTSRFPFADLVGFDGDRARMLDVPPFTPAEGSALLAEVGGAWLADGERRALVRAVDGHALATGVLGGLLAAHPPASDLAALHAELAAATRTDARVRKVLSFYASRLAESDRYLLAAVSLFARPISADAVLAVARHDAFAARLAGWTQDMVEDAIRSRLSGLASWHPGGTISAHPLVRDTFRPLVMDAAGTAAETSLAGLPTGMISNRADALSVVEAIELLLEAGQWQAADDMYRGRGGNGWPFMDLPAARLGQRACSAFVATTPRRAACASHLGPSRLRFYLAGTGLFAKNAGDVATAQEFLRMAVQHDRDAGDLANLAVSLRNLTECLGQLGQTDSARAAADEALAYVESTGLHEKICHSRAFLGWTAALVGDTAEADQQFIAADLIQLANGSHLYSLRGTQWGEWLTRTGRLGPARDLTTRNFYNSRTVGPADSARCERLLGRLALADGDTVAAGERLEAAARRFREGDYLTELAITLTDLASCAQATGDLDAAERHVAEAIAIAAPRGLVPAQSAALTVRAHIRIGQTAVTADQDLLFQGRDDADAALRLAVRHHLAWHELDALRAHALLDDAEYSNHGWAAKADALYKRLIPHDLDPDPLTTVLHLFADQKAAK
jgi:tetratricopeptide (TPR) repeat protein